MIDVATGEVKAARAPACLQCLALGSCVAVILYDEDRRVGGIAHVMLPSSVQSNADEDNVLKHADRAIPELIRLMRDLGARNSALVARLVGGALVIPGTSDIGKENIEAIRYVLAEQHIQIIDEHIGGDIGRSVIFDVASGELHINGKSVSVVTSNASLETIQTTSKKSPEYIKRLEDEVAELTKELNDRAEELDTVRKATFNLLEDLEKEREKLMVEKVKAETLVQDLEKFKLAVDNVSDCIVITDAEGIVIYANGAVGRITGYPPEEALGKKSGSLWKKPMSEEYYQELWDTIKNRKKIFVSEIQNKRKNGEVYTAAVTISPILDKAGEVRFFVSIERDISKEKEIDRAKSEFVSLASHQLKTPLTSIGWYADMLLNGRGGKMTEKGKEYLEKIFNNHHRMVALVNSLLNVSRIEMGSLAIIPQRISLVEIADGVFEELIPQIQTKKLHIEKIYEKDLPMISADPQLMRMVFQNLLSNSVKYTSEQGRITLSIKKDNQNILATVSDNGYGIPQAQQSHIFTKLFRADNVREHDTDGTGLGLYIVKAVVDQSGGKIWFESTENKGTDFYVSFPLKGMEQKEGTKGLI